MIKHNLKNTRIYRVWLNMKQRCYYKKNKQYKDYGGRGIVVCEEWKNNPVSFCEWAYKNGFDEKAPRGKYTLDRIDVNKDYTPNNCRFVSMLDQAHNLRKNVNITINNETHCLNEWSRILNVNTKVFWAGYNRSGYNYIIAKYKNKFNIQ